MDGRRFYEMLNNVGCSGRTKETKSNWPLSFAVSICSDMNKTLPYGGCTVGRQSISSAIQTILRRRRRRLREDSRSALP
jgi:hypothetical protein